MACVFSPKNMEYWKLGLFGFVLSACFIGAGSRHLRFQGLGDNLPREVSSTKHQSDQTVEYQHHVLNRDSDGFVQGRDEQRRFDQVQSHHGQGRDEQRRFDQVQSHHGQGRDEQRRYDQVKSHHGQGREEQRRYDQVQSHKGQGRGEQQRFDQVQSHQGLGEVGKLQQPSVEVRHLPAKSKKTGHGLRALVSLHMVDENDGRTGSHPGPHDYNSVHWAGYDRPRRTTSHPSQYGTGGRNSWNNQGAGQHRSETPDRGRGRNNVNHYNPGHSTNTPHSWHRNDNNPHQDRHVSGPNWQVHGNNQRPPNGGFQRSTNGRRGPRKHVNEYGEVSYDYYVDGEDVFSDYSYYDNSYPDRTATQKMCVCHCCGAEQYQDYDYELNNRFYGRKKRAAFSSSAETDVGSGSGDESTPGEVLQEESSGSGSDEGDTYWIYGTVAVPGQTSEFPRGEGATVTPGPDQTDQDSMEEGTANPDQIDQNYEGLTTEDSLKANITQQSNTSRDHGEGGTDETNEISEEWDNIDSDRTNEIFRIQYENTAIKEDGWREETTQHGSINQASTTPRGNTNQGNWEGETTQHGNTNQGNWEGETTQHGNTNQGNREGETTQHGNTNQGNWEGETTQHGNTNQGNWEGETTQHGNTNQGSWERETTQHGNTNQGNWEGETTHHGNTNQGSWEGEATQHGNTNQGNWEGETTHHGNTNQGNWEGETTQHGNTNQGNWEGETPQTNEISQNWDTLDSGQTNKIFQIQHGNTQTNEDTRYQENFPRPTTEEHEYLIPRTRVGEDNLNLDVGDQTEPGPRLLGHGRSQGRNRPTAIVDSRDRDTNGGFVPYRQSPDWSLNRPTFQGPSSQQSPLDPHTPYFTGRPNYGNQGHLDRGASMDYNYRGGSSIPEREVCICACHCGTGDGSLFRPQYDSYNGLGYPDYNYDYDYDYDYATFYDPQLRPPSSSYHNSGNNGYHGNNYVPNARSRGGGWLQQRSAYPQRDDSRFYKENPKVQPSVQGQLWTRSRRVRRSASSSGGTIFAQFIKHTKNGERTGQTGH